MSMMVSDTIGLLIKNISDFYYVEVGDTLIECKARGIFRRTNVTPLVGDRVVISVDGNEKGIIEEILPRKNFLVRPPLANIDRLYIISSLVDPRPSTLIIDKLIALAENIKIEPVIIINKSDLSDDNSLFETYSNAGFITINASAVTGLGIDEIRHSLTGLISAFTGNSGVGKSSILNLIDERLSIATGEISKKLGRGRHTTRHVELYKIEGGFVADTPGFSSVDLDKCDYIVKDNLQFCFREFLPYIAKCKFNSCSHLNGKGCVIVEAVENGLIAKSRYDSYCEMYKDAEKINEWDRK